VIRSTFDHQSKRQLEDNEMANTPRDALHQVHTATNDVLTGYDTMLERAEPEIMPILRELTSMHRNHADALKARLTAFGDSGEDDTSFRGTMNSLAVTMRDWIADLDEDSLNTVKRGEKALLDIYDDALQNWSTQDDPQTAELLNKHHQEIQAGITKIPAV
jgi:uncharacterized protein (TIGR02284 family)